MLFLKKTFRQFVQQTQFMYGPEADKNRLGSVVSQ